MVMTGASRTKNISSDNRKDSRRFYQETPSQEIISLSAPVLTSFIRDAQSPSELAGSCWLPMLPICAIPCKWARSSKSCPLTIDYSGGLGLTGGIADVGSLFDALRAMRNGKADDSILDKYSEVRREKWAKIIDPMSRANFKRVCLDEAEADRNEFWALCKKMEEDDELARQMAQVSLVRVMKEASI
jgi:hypothetical protein